MPTKHRKRLYASILIAAVPLAVAGVVIPALAGDFTDDAGYDFDCDDQRDPLYSSEWEKVDGQSQAGAVTVRYSTTDKTATISQNTPGVAGTAEAYDHFGYTATSFDENQDGCDDLVVSATGETVRGNDGKDHESAGMVWIIPGSPSGLNPAGSRGFHQDSPGVPGSVSDRDEAQTFGRKLAAESSTDQPYLLIGSPWAGKAEGGTVHLVRGGKVALLTQDSSGVSGSAELGDWFGGSLAVGDQYFAVGAVEENLGSSKNAGMVHVFSVPTTGTAVKQIGAFHQDTAGVSGAVERSDRFGRALSVIPYQPTSSGPVMPLVSVGTPGERVGDAASAGMAHLITIPSPGKLKQIAAPTENTPGVPDKIDADQEDQFGLDTTLAVKGSASVGTPASTYWAVAAAEKGDWIPPEDPDEPGGGTDPSDPQVMVFSLAELFEGEVPVLNGEDFGVPIKERGLGSGSSDPQYLYFWNSTHRGGVYGVPWENILNGQNQPVVQYRVNPQS